MDTSRNWLGFYTEDLIRAIEYPWVLKNNRSKPGCRIKDIGAGVSPFLVPFGEKVILKNYHRFLSPQ